MDEPKRVLNEEGRSVWDEKAAFWDALHGEEGNRFHRELVGPAVERLLGLQAGERVVDVACGSGVLARRLAALGARVTAVDFSEALVGRAQARGQQGGPPIDYGVADATDEAALAALGEGSFDAVVSTMALMDMPAIGPLYRAARRLLRPGGRFVFVTAHPAFNSNGPAFVAEMDDEAGVVETVRSVKIARYLQVPPVKGMGAPGEPAPHTLYHRPLHVLLGEAFAAGFVLDGLEEPAFSRDDAGDTLLGWYALPQIPPVLAGRMVLRD
jgi:SAM-dependent methyltransferase